MTTQLFVNLPVRDLAAAKGFFTALGFAFNPMFADENMEAMVVNDHTSVLLLTEPYFKSFTKKDIAEAGTEVVLAVGAESRERVDELADAAVAAGGQAAGEPTDLGFLYRRAFTDLDGHLWEAMHMAMPAN
ncbi:VOC family protein [Actinokineospora sp. UTMC 2448]|uniref:VOC family protein n=1 Tax=Actinokineospora sp. UTMC 2448 TaxID=2268449 RepID=UPI0021640CBE|nr:VOC family protein [Actinokineospora sp. UTMC 2448]UVS81985.1 putative lactoylglutathione lyase [Actinokineospora sp. UTMC 2448]